MATITRAPLDVATEIGLIPVVVVDTVQQAELLGSALVEGGLPIAEVTLRTAAALDSIRVLSEHPDLTVGAGTVLEPRQLDAAVAAGAQFIVSPGISDRVVAAASAARVPIVPGATTATEVQRGLELGLETLKFFPAATSGGATAIAALSAPFPQVSFVPTGGISADTLHEYLTLPGVTAVGGSWMVPRALLTTDHRAELVELIRSAVRAAAAARSTTPRQPQPNRTAP